MAGSYRANRRVASGRKPTSYQYNHVMLIWLIAIYALAIPLVLALAFGIRSVLPANKHYPLNIALGTLLLAPSLAPATIAAIPMPYGVLLVLGTLSGAGHEAINIAIDLWRWHVPSFLLTGLTMAVLLRLMGLHSEDESRFEVR